MDRWIDKTVKERMERKRAATTYVSTVGIGEVRDLNK